MHTAKFQTSTETDPKSELYQSLTYRLSRVQAKLNLQATQMLLETSGITLTQWRVIVLISVAQRTRLSELVRHTAFDKGMISRNIKKLVEEGIVCAEPDKIDHRAQVLTLTNKGQEVLKKTTPYSHARQNLLNNALSPTELNVLHKALDKLELAAETRISVLLEKDHDVPV